MTSAKRQSAPAHPNWVLVTTILASGLAFIDGTVVNVGLSAIGATFKGGAADLQIVPDAVQRDCGDPSMMVASHAAASAGVFLSFGRSTIRLARCMFSSEMECTSGASAGRSASA